MLDGAKLTLCTSAESLTYLDAGQHVTAGCVDASDRLRDALPDAVEYPADPAQRPAVGSVQITLNARPGLCEAFLSRANNTAHSEAIWAASVWDAPFNRMLMRPVTFNGEEQFYDGLPASLPDFNLPDLVSEHVFKRLPAVADSTDWAPFLTWFEADFDNDGLRDLILRFSGRSGADDSDVFYVVHGKAIERIKAMMSVPEAAFPKWAYQLEHALSDAAGVNSYADGFGNPVNLKQSRYTYQLSFTSAGETLVFAAALHRRNRPTAIIYKPLAGGKSQQVCVYQRVEENW